jgi:hypothetical protein
MGIKTIIGTLEEAGAGVSEHGGGQLNIRKGGRLIVWYPQSKLRKARDVSGNWHPDIDLDTIIRWLGKCSNAPQSEPKPAYVPPQQAQPRNDDAEKIMVLFAKRLEAIERHLAGRDGFVPAVDAHMAVEQRLMAFLGTADLARGQATDPTAASRQE